jgi:hypothetical protein
MDMTRGVTVLPTIAVLVGLAGIFCVLWDSARRENAILKRDLKRREARKQGKAASLPEPEKQTVKSPRSSPTVERQRELEQELAVLRVQASAVPWTLLVLLLSITVVAVVTAGFLYYHWERATTRVVGYAGHLEQELELERNKTKDLTRQLDEAKRTTETYRKHLDQQNQVVDQLKRQPQQLQEGFPRARELEKTNGELKRLLHKPWLRLVTVGPVRSADAAAALQHDQLLQSFRYLRSQRFRSLGEALARFAKAKQGAQSIQKCDTLQNLQFILAEGIFADGSQFLLQQKSAAHGSVGSMPSPAAIAIRDKVKGELERFLGTRLSDDLVSHLDGVVREAITFLEDLLTSTPPGLLLFPEKGTAFDPETHETCDSSRPAPGAQIDRTIFPGYVVSEPQKDRVWEKAQVETRQADGGNLAQSAWPGKPRPSGEKGQRTGGI